MTALAANRGSRLSGPWAPSTRRKQEKVTAHKTATVPAPALGLASGLWASGSPAGEADDLNCWVIGWPARFS